MEAERRWREKGLGDEGEGGWREGGVEVVEAATPPPKEIPSASGQLV